jgi:catechol 2,3-dioxygenase-like lactoylglutathione lyase family enzyme
MFACVTVTASDLAASRRFYETVLGGLPNAFALAEGEPTRHLHIAFAAAAREEVDAFWRRGIAAGHASDGEPGLRPQYDPSYYGAFLLDPDGNSVEACTGFRERDTSPIDHLWIGVADLAASRRFWEGVVSGSGLRIVEREGRFHVAGSDRSLAVVADGRPATENVAIALARPAGGVVDVRL